MEKKLTKNIAGYFNVRIYNETKPKEKWQIKGEDDTITFTTCFFHECPDEFKTYAKEGEKDGEKRFYVTFKIGSRAKWYDSKGQLIAKTLNADLENKKFDCRFRYVQLDPQPNSTKGARGYWVDSVQIAEFVDNPFATDEQSEQSIDLNDKKEIINDFAQQIGADVEFGGELQF